MPTIKSRIHVTPSATLYQAIEKIAARDNVRLASKVAELLQHAIEIEEDEILETIVKKRDRRSIKFISHAKVWT